MKVYYDHDSKYSSIKSSNYSNGYNNYNNYNNKRPNTHFHSSGPYNKKPKFNRYDSRQEEFSNGKFNKLNGNSFDKPKVNGSAENKSNGHGGNVVKFNGSSHKFNGVPEKQNSNFANKNKSLKDQREDLPVYKLKKRLLEEIKKTNSLIVIGETGSGKTTQIPQILLESGLLGSKDRVAITSPRRVAAITIAQRVAQEQNCALGTSVGYCVRFEDVTGPKTRIKYVTDGILVREAMADECLSGYSYVILDEAHERSVHTDVLLGVARRAQKLREERNEPGLKLIIMSATMDVDKYAEYFKAPVVYLEGRQHEIRTFHAETAQDDYVLAALVTVFQIHRSTPANEDIVVFLTGQEEIEIASQEARKVAKELDRDKYPPLKIFPLYSALPTHQQLDAMKPSPPGTRKLVLATNVAETSITIGGIRTVIDTGRVKVRTHHPATGMDVLRIEKVSKAQAWQRCGRAGREAAGKCYRTLTQEEFEKLEDMPTPEIQRCSLAGVALQLLAIGIDLTTFDFMDKPPEEGVKNAVSCLERLKAVKGIPMQLTGIGKTMASFPLDPRFTKVLLASVQHDCLEEALSVVALLSGENIYIDPISKRQQATAARTKFVSEEGDHVTLLNVYRNFEKVHDSKKKSWCYDNFLHFRNLNYAMNVRSQLATLADKANLTKSSCGNNTETLRKALLEGLFDNLATLQRDQNYVTVTTKQPVQIHPCSTLHGTKPQLVLFTEVIATTQCYIRDLSVIDPYWLK